MCRVVLFLLVSVFVFCLCRISRPTVSTRTVTRFPYRTLFRSFGAGASAMGLCFILLAGVVLRSADGGGSDRAARQLFGFSILYLFVLFTLLILDRAPGLLAPGFWEGSVLSGVGLAG